MYINNVDLTPPQDVLDRCHQVIIGDPAFVMWKMKRWCRENNLSLVWSELVETSDVSSQFDECAAFYFIDPADATAFTLKFK
jgi:hypothetical protein